MIPKHTRWLQCMCLGALAGALAACLDPVGSERVGYSTELRPASEDVASVEDDDVLKNRIGTNAQVDGRVPLRSAFAAGHEVRYWDFGSSPTSVEPLWTFMRRDRDGGEDHIDHLDLVDSLPGDDNYSPLRQIFRVFVTDAYAGQRITSLRALEDALELGLVEEPEATESYVDRPVALADAELSAADGGAPTHPEAVYCRGRTATHFRIGGDAERVFPLGRRVATPSAYALRRQHQALVLDEARWEADLDEDGDQDDSNMIFAFDQSASGYTGLWKRVDVTVPASYGFGDSRAEEDLFEQTDAGLQALADAVISWQETEDVHHLVLVSGEDVPRSDGEGESDE